MSDVTPEIWINESRSQVGVMRSDPIRGTRVDLVQPGRQIMISPAERKLTEDAVAKQSDNPFRNGQFSHTQLVETADDVEAIRSDPNVIGRGEIEEILKLQIKAMETRLKAITSERVLQRIIEVADEQGATTRRVQAVRDRLAELAPPAAAPGEPVFAGGPGPREPWYPRDGRDGGGTIVGGA